MKQKVILMLALLFAVAQGVWAQNPTSVSDETSLRDAIADGAVWSVSTMLTSARTPAGIATTLRFRPAHILEQLTPSAARIPKAPIPGTAVTAPQLSNPKITLSRMALAPFAALY